MSFLNIFRRNPTRTDLWKSRFEAFLVGSGIILFWRGIWDLADMYILPNYPTLSAIVSMLIGMGILMLTRNFVNQFIDDAVEEAEKFE